MTWYIDSMIRVLLIAGDFVGMKYSLLLEFIDPHSQQHSPRTQFL
jgi:hypothetical protein